MSLEVEIRDRGVPRAKNVVKLVRRPVIRNMRCRRLTGDEEQFFPLFCKRLLARTYSKKRLDECPHTRLEHQHDVAEEKHGQKRGDEQRRA